MTKTDGSSTVSYVLGVGDRLATWTGGSYSYNAAGCVTHIVRGSDTLDLAWNGQYQLVSVFTNGAFAESYTYDALGRRVSTTTLEDTVRHVYDGVQCIADIDGNGEVVASYTWGAGIDNLLAIHIGGATYYPLTDVQGTVWGYADANNNIVACFSYDAWGNILSSASSIPALATNRYRFQCREWSAATGLVNFRARWYDSVTGRWLSKDPIGINGGLNLYAFCGNDPVGYIDKFGSCRKKGDAEKEKDIIRSLRGTSDTGLLYDILIAFNMHSGGGPMDYSAKPNPKHWQFSDGEALKPNQFGNYMAGYDAGYSSNAPLLYMGTRIGGMVYGANGSSEGWTDSGSVSDINRGFSDGVVDKAIDDALNDPFVQTINSVLDLFF